MRYSHVLGAAVVGLAATTANAGLSVSLVAVPIDPVKQATDVALQVNRSRVFDVVVSATGTDKWASGDIQAALTTGGASGAFYVPTTGGSDIYQASPSPAAVEYDTYVKSAISANTPNLLGKAQYPVESGIGTYVMSSTAMDVAWGDLGSQAGAQTSGSVARLSIVGTKGMIVGGRVGATNNTVAPATIAASVPLFGDIDNDGAINFQDINPFVALFTSTPTTQQLWAADFTWDGVINFQDINGFVAALTSGGPVPAEALAPLGALVPEPASASLVATAVFGLVARRRRS